MYDYLPSQVRARNHRRNYVVLLRVHYHCSFVGVLLGALVVTRHWPELLLWRTFLLYVSMNVLRCVRGWNRKGTEDSSALRKAMAQMRRHVSFATSTLAFVACSFFLWMFFAAATLEQTAELGWISAPPGQDAHALGVWSECLK